MDEPLTYSHKIVQAVTVANGAAGTSAINGEIIDMQGFEFISFIVQFGPIVGGAVTSIKVQRDTDAAMGTAADVAGTAQTVADDFDNKVKTIDWLRPGERYVRLVVSRGTQAATCAAIALLYGASAKPVTQPTDVVGEVHKDKAEGTA